MSRDSSTSLWQSQKVVYRRRSTRKYLRRQLMQYGIERGTAGESARETPGDAQTTERDPVGTEIQAGMVQVAVLVVSWAVLLLVEGSAVSLVVRG